MVLRGHLKRSEHGTPEAFADAAHARSWQLYTENLSLIEENLISRYPFACTDTQRITNEFSDANSIRGDTYRKIGKYNETTDLNQVFNKVLSLTKSVHT